MKLNDIRKQYNSSKKTRDDIDKVVTDVCNALVTFDYETLKRIIEWADDEEKTHFDFWIKDQKIRLYLVIEIVEKILKIDYKDAYKHVWRNVYKENLQVNHGKICFSAGSRGYGFSDHPYCIWRKES